MDRKNIGYKTDETKDFNPEREKAFDEYISYQSDLEKLHKLWVLTSFLIRDHYTQHEPDFDNFTDKQKKEIKEAEGDGLKHAKLLKTLPHHDQPYYDPLFLIAPNYIWDAVGKQDACLDTLATEVIVLINERIKIKLDTYKKYLTNNKYLTK